MPARSASASVTSSHIGFSTTDPKFGSHSLLADEYQVDGGGAKSFYPDVATITVSPTDTNYYLDEDHTWTIEFFFRRASGNADNSLISLFNLGGLVLRYQFQSSYNGGQLVPRAGGSPLATTANMDIGTAGAYHHVAFVCVGDEKITMYYDGTRIVNAQSFSVGSGRAFTVGATNDQTTHTIAETLFFDEIRVSSVARYSGATLTVPTSAFADDDDTLALLHLDNNYNDTQTRNGAATLTSTANISVSAKQTVSPNTDLLPYTWDTVPNDTWQDFVFDRWVVSGVLFTSTTTVAASAQILINGSAGLTVTANLSAAALRVKLSTADLNSSAQLTVAAGILLNAASGLNVQAGQSTQANMTRGGASALVSQVTQVASAALTLAGASALNTTATQVVSGRLLKFASLFIDGFATLGAAAGLNKNIASGLNTTATVTATATVIQNANVALTVTANQLASAGLNKTIASGLNTTAQVLVTGILLRNATATLGAVAQLTATEAKQVFGQSQLNTTVALTSGATVIKNAQAQLTALAFELTVGKIIRNASASLGVNAQFTGDIDLVLLESDFIFRVLPETRQYILDSESRIQGVLSDTRQYRVGSESRNHRVLPETRTISSEDFLIG